MTLDHLSPPPAAITPQQGDDPLRALWKAFGSPDPVTAMNKTGTCTRCRAHTSRGSRVASVVSDKFTGWDQYTEAADPLWCPACAWGHTTTDLRTRPWIIPATTSASETITPTASPVPATSADLAALLSQPLPQHVAVTVPVSRHKHILPAARWGHLTSDDRQTRWGLIDVERFTVVARLRRLGFSENALSEPTPRFDQLLATGSDMTHVLADWDALAAWRADPFYLHVACIATRTATSRTGGGAAP